MPKRYFNWKLAVVLLIGCIVLAVTAFGLRKWHRSRRAYNALEEGIKAYEQSEWQKAAYELGRYIVVAQDDIDVYLKYADAQFRIRPSKQSNIQQAIAAYRSVLRIDKANPEAVTKLFELYMLTRFYGEAELIVTRAIEVDPSPDNRRMYAIALASQRKYDLAAAELKEIINENPEYVSAYDVLADLIERRPEEFNDEPLTWLNKAIENNPSSVEAYVNRGSYYLRNDQKENALADLKQVEQLPIDDDKLRLSLASVFIGADLLEDAEKHLSIVYETDSTDEVLWRIWSQLAMKSDSKEKKIWVADEGLKQLSDDPWDFMPVAAELYIRAGNVAKASECVEQLVSKEIAPVVTAFLEGLIADESGDKYSALKHWSRSIELGNKSPQVKLAIAFTLDRLGDRQSAVQQLRSLISEQPNYLNAHIQLARIFLETRNFSEAVESAESALKLSRNNGEAHLLYVQARMQELYADQTDFGSPLWREVEQYLDKLAEASDNAFAIDQIKAKLAILTQKYDEAEKITKRLRIDNPSSTDLDMLDVDLFVMNDQTDKAVSKLRDIINNSPQSVEAVERLSLLYLAKGEKQKTEELIKEALERVESTTGKRKLALLLAGLYEKWDRSGDGYRLISKLNDESSSGDIAFIRRLLRFPQTTKDQNLAQQLVDQIKNLEGSNGWQWRYEQSKIWLNDRYFDEKYTQVVSLLKENLLANPDDQNSRILLARAYEKAGQFQLAATAYTDALARSPKNVQIIIPTVAVLYRINENKRADEILKRAADDKIFHPQLQKLEYTSYLRKGQLESAADVLEEIFADNPENMSICLELAKHKIRQKNFDDAEQLLEQLVQKQPDSLAVAAVQIDLNIARQNNAQALAICDQIVNKQNDATAFILRAKTLVRLDKISDAEKDFEKAVKLEPENPAIWAERSLFLRSIGKTELALTDMLKAIDLDPENIQMQKNAIDFLISSNDRNMTQKARELIDKGLEWNPKDVDFLVYKAGILIAASTDPALAEAEKILQSASQEETSKTQIWSLLAQIALKKGKLLDAIDITLKGLVRNPNDKNLLLLKALAEAQRAPALAVPTLKALIEYYPEDTDIKLRLADLYYNINQYDKTIELLQNALLEDVSDSAKRKIEAALAAALYKDGQKKQSQDLFVSLEESKPDDYVPLVTQTRLLRDEKHWQQLTEKVTQWCEKNPDNTIAPILIAQELAALGDNEDAVTTAQKLLRMTIKNHPECVGAITTLAMVLQSEGQMEEPIKLYEKVVQIQPENVVAVNNLAWLICQHENNYQKALELANSALEKSPDYLDLIDTRGVIFYELGQYDNAVQDFNKCVQLYLDNNPSKTASYFHCAKTLLKTDRKNDAIDALNNAIRLNGEVGGLLENELKEAQNLLETLLQGV